MVELALLVSNPNTRVCEQLNLAQRAAASWPCPDVDCWSIGANHFIPESHLMERAWMECS